MQCVKPIYAVLFVFVLIAPAAVVGQDGPQRQPAPPREQARPQRQPPEPTEYDRKFFDQLRIVFGRFRDADLQDAFQAAGAIECSELITDKGEWRELAFFNEDRKLGDWYRRSIDEVKIDPAVYIFQGPCSGDRGAVQLTTKFPVDESVEAYKRGRIPFEQIALNVNKTVSAAFDSRTQAYTFDLPYLFLISRQGDLSVYSLYPPRLADRYRYATEVTDRWDCKSVKADDVTYRFLICRTRTISLESGARSRLPFGASAYIILSDGKEASSSVKLVFADDARGPEPAAANDAPDGAGGRPVADDPATAPSREGWQIPRAEAKAADVGNDEFRIRFSPQTWAGKIGSSEILLDQKLSALSTTKPPAGADYCAWRPGSSNLINRLMEKEPDESVRYSVKGLDKDKQSDASILFEMKTHTGTRLGVLQCYFPRTDFAGNVAFSRWVAIVGGHLTLEVR